MIPLWAAAGAHGGRPAQNRRLGNMPKQTLDLSHFIAKVPVALQSGESAAAIGRDAARPDPDGLLYCPCPKVTLQRCWRDTALSQC